MNIRRIISIVAVSFAVICGVLFVCDAGQRYSGNLRAKASTVAHLELEPAFVHGDDDEPRTTFDQGEPIFVHEHYSKPQSCHSTISNVFVQNRKVYRGESYLTWVKEGEYNVSENVVVPPGVKPGIYRFIRKTVSFCGGDQVYYTKNFDLRIEIKAPAANAEAR